MMKRIASIFFAIALAPILLASEDDSKDRQITVTGNAEVRVVPDEVQIALGVESFAGELAEAKRDNDSKIAAVVSVARGIGVAPEYISTEYLQIEPRYDDEYRRRTFLGYVVRKSVVITLRDIPRFESLLSDTLTAGANFVHGIEFRTTELRKHRDKARSLALIAAREKAEAMAGEYGQAVGRVIQISEGFSGWWSPYGSWWGPRWGGAMSQNVAQTGGPGAASAEGPTVPGQISVSASINVTFELVDTPE